VTQATASAKNLKKLSDLVPVAGTMVLGGPPECPTRPFCALGLKNVYGITFKDFKPLDTGGPLTITALEGKQIDVGLLFTSDPSIVAKNFVLLDDDKHLQLADNIAGRAQRAPSERRRHDQATPELDQCKAHAGRAQRHDKQVAVDKADSKVVAAAC